MNAMDQVVYSPAFGRAVLAPVARWGYGRQRRTGATPGAAYSAMRKLYGCASLAPFAALQDRAAREHPLLALDAEPQGVAAAEIERVVAALDADGFAILGTRLDAASCDELEAVARAASCSLIGVHGDARRTVWDDDAPVAVRYDVPEEDIVQSAVAQQLVADASLLAIAQRHLGAMPIQDLVAMWWSAAVPGETDADADAVAQRYHFDLDRLRFVKVFVFLTDVDEDTGPHSYVRGSHRHQPPALRRDGRHTDDEVLAAYPGDERLVTGPRGTMFLADTIGMHKGVELRHGHRLVFQTEYTTSLFGSPFTRPTVVAPGHDLASAVARYPETFQRFVLGAGG